MGRRRGKRDESSPVETTAELIYDASKRWPIVGLFFCVLFLAIGGALQANPKAFLGFAPIIGLFVLLAGLGCGVVAMVGLLRNLRQTGESAGRWMAWFRSTRTPPTSALSIIHRSRSAGRSPPATFPGVWSIDAVHALSWQQFEQLIADLFRRQGYVVREHARQSAGTGDGGVDLILTDPRTPGGEYLVQCKQYKSWDVGEPKVREFYGAMAAWQTRCEGIMVTCGRYTLPAKDFAKDKPLRLIDGDGLVRLLNQHNAIAPAVQHAAPQTVQAASLLPPMPTTPSTPQSPSRGPAPTGNAAEAAGVPACPRCKVAMVRRVAGKGPRKGLPFWGCANYPRCTVLFDIVS